MSAEEIARRRELAKQKHAERMQQQFAELSTEGSSPKIIVLLKSKYKIIVYIAVVVVVWKQI